MTELSELKKINETLDKIFKLLKYPLTGDIDESIVKFTREVKD